MYNPYENFMYQNMYRPQIQGTRFVDGLAGAQACVTPLGSKTLLMDNNEDKFYIKETDLNGVSTVSQYAFTKIEDRPQTADYITREEFEKWKEHYESAIKQQPADSALQPVAGNARTGSTVPQNDFANTPGGPGQGAAVPQGQFRFDGGV